MGNTPKPNYASIGQAGCWPKWQKFSEKEAVWGELVSMIVEIFRDIQKALAAPMECLHQTLRIAQQPQWDNGDGEYYLVKLAVDRDDQPRLQDGKFQHMALGDLKGLRAREWAHE